jgi:DNA-binding transcriptional regulator LsrR (DeoR family)
MTRICVLLLDIHDRLRRRGLINRPTFNLPLTQEQIADHLGLTLVHVNRTLRRLREQKLVIVDRQVVIIMDMEQLRSLAQGLPKPAELPDADVPLQGLAPAVNPGGGQLTAD